MLWAARSSFHGRTFGEVFSRSLAPRITALRRDLDEYLRYYNTDRAHTGRLTKGRVPADIVFGARKMASVK